MATTEPCIFCRIVAGDAPCDRVYEDELTLAFMDLFPVGEGHLLVIPKQHHQDIFEADEASLLAVMAISRRIAHALKTALEPDGIGVHQLNGAAAGQTVFHYHMHLIPRNQGDPIALHGRKRGEPAEMEAIAARIRAVLDREG
ncbi:MAG: HIT family protein [bacterium]|nr:HIT family protein [bacterium]MCP5066303.1 HIT family protein [bacterium]